MALYKELEKANGVITKYHRIVSMNIITNVQNVIEVASYTSQEKREQEIEALKQGLEHDIYINTLYLTSSYEQTMTVEGAYEWLKTQEMFVDALDC